MEIKSWKDMLPCWGKHARMGHVEFCGQFFPGPTPDTVLGVQPALEGDDTHEALEQELEVLPVGGPAFFGFALWSEARVLEALSWRRPYKARAAAPRLEVAESDWETAGDGPRFQHGHTFDPTTGYCQSGNCQAHRDCDNPPCLEQDTPLGIEDVLF